MASLVTNLKVPYSTPMLDASGLLTTPWSDFFRDLRDRVDPLGQELSFQLANNQSVAANIEGMSFGSAGVSKAVVEYLVQRITTSTGASELVESGILHIVYNPTSANWSIVEIGTPGPDDAGITFSITDGGQVKYQTSNITGTAQISRIVWRVLTVQGKSTVYSRVGASR